MHIAERDHAAISWQGARGAVIDLMDIRKCVRRANHLRVQDCAWRVVGVEADVPRISGAASGLLTSVERRNRRSQRFGRDTLVALNEGGWSDLTARNDGGSCRCEAVT
jgi:hypothetical protein